MATMDNISEEIKENVHPTNITGNSIGKDVKFASITHVESISEKKRKRNVIEDANERRKRLEKEDQERNLREQRYKHLLQLLDRSQIYSKYLINKIETSIQSGENKKKNKNITKTPDKPISKTPPKKGHSEGTRSPRKALSPKMIEEELNRDNEPETTYSDENEKNIRLKYFEGKLRDYQREGLQWLIVLYENGLNGILADEMGLGKTIQIIALISHLLEKKQEGPFLIVVPLSTLPNWTSEFKRFAPKVPVVVFYGNKQEKLALRQSVKQKVHVDGNFKTQPVVLTTYETPLSDQYLHTLKWRYIIVDEAQRIKNHECLLIATLKSFQSMNRLLITGTPLQNNLSELWSLLNFLLPDIFNNLAVFESWFDPIELQQDIGTEKLLKQEEEQHIIQFLREILKPFMLRRTKLDVCLDIPPKKVLIVYAPITELQRELYTAVLQRDMDSLSMINVKPPEVNINSERPKRQCRLKNKYSSDYVDPFSDTPSNSSSESINFTEYDTSAETWKNNLDDKNNLAAWKNFANITERNYQFFIRIQFRNRLPMYKKIVNHPFLVHCPLDASGLPKIDEELVKASGKLLVLDAMLAKLHSRGHKVLLFSTMTTLLDILEDYLELRPYQYVRLDGTVSMKDRENRIDIFNNDPSVFLFLISTRAGGVGLNLTGADTVVMYDSDWNPQIDIQAMARCHRIGQTRPVVVYRLCTKGTIDEIILNRAEGKRKLEKVVISERIKASTKEDLWELKTLLDSSDFQVVKSVNDVYTEEELDKILDRTDLIEKVSVKTE
ncbi:lymphoid-specific helicase [Orussus abietinus]|uniref:lymphoid-specific helicase n=1 Tax=Orussus abietinus TaxID=222816 RepID=UPI000626111D|nr:lymphoid-specific helicase [Orussus abietinus]